MPDEDDRPITEEEQALAREAESLIAAAMADVRAPQSLREAIERERQRAASRDRPRFWRRPLGSGGSRHRRRVLAVVAIALGAVATQEPSLNGVYAAAGLDPPEAAPRSVGGAPPVLAAQVGNLAFPDWRESFGWRRSAAAWTSRQGATSRRSSIATPRASGSATRSWPAPRTATIRPVGRSPKRQDLQPRAQRRSHHRHLDQQGHLRDRCPVRAARRAVGRSGRVAERLVPSVVGKVGATGLQPSTFGPSDFEDEDN